MPNVIDLRENEETQEDEETSGTEERSEYERRGDEILSWVGVDHSSREKTPEWYWVLAIFVFAFVSIGVVFSNFILSLLAITSGAALALIGSRPPFEVHAAITNEGVVVGGKLYRFEDLQSFWVFYEPPYHKELSLRSKHTFSSHVRVPLGDMNPALVHETLMPFLKEVREEESLVDIIARRIGL